MAGNGFVQTNLKIVKILPCQEFLKPFKKIHVNLIFQCRFARFLFNNFFKSVKYNALYFINKVRAFDLASYTKNLVTCPTGSKIKLRFFKISAFLILKKRSNNNRKGVSFFLQSLLHSLFLLAFLIFLEENQLLKFHQCNNLRVRCLLKFPQCP